MMAAVAGTFSDVKVIKSRKVCVLSIEVPIEKADEALRILGGIPRPDEERWVGLARLNAGSSNGRTSDFDSENAGSSPAPASKKAWPDKTAAEQAGILCAEWRFQRFMCADSEEEAARRVRAHCGVKSRRDLDDSQRARVLWHGLDNDFRVSVGQMAAPR